MTENKEKTNSWTLTGVAAVITAMGGIYLGYLGSQKPSDSKTPSASASSESKQVSVLSEYPDINGSWKMDNGINAGLAVIQQSGKTFTISLEDGRSMTPGSFLDKSNLQVLFQNDSGCCSGELKGNRIVWSNGTKWFRQQSVVRPDELTLGQTKLPPYELCLEVIFRVGIAYPFD